jgi:uncharacterized protein YgbK (DUF1537 family)
VATETTAGPVASREPATPAEPVPWSATSLIDWGRRHSNSRIQRQAEQARAALANLQQAQRKEAVVSAAEERLRELQQQVAEAEQALREAKGLGAPTTVTVPRADGNEAALIRTWAREQGYPVNDRGVLPTRVVLEYRAAQEG